MELEKMIELLEVVCNVYYDAEEVGTIENLLYEYYVDSDMFTQEELDLITRINGWNVETFNDVLYVRFGYRDLEKCWRSRNDNNNNIFSICTLLLITH